jgi:hypothetical protein
MKSALLIGALLIASTVSEPVIPEKSLKITSYNKKKQHLKAPKKVYINSFKALFEVYEEAEARSSGSKNERANRTTFTSGTVTKLGVQISGVDVADFQGIIDEAYAKYTRQLEDAGFEILTAEDVANLEVYEGWTKMEGGASSDAQAKGFVQVTPTGFSYMVKGIAKSGREKGTFSDRGPQISKEMDDVYVADVNFVFPFVTLDPNSSGWKNSSSVKAVIDYRLEPLINTGKTNEQASLTSLAKGFGAAGDAYMLESQVRFISGKDIGNNPFFDAKVGLKKSVTFEDVFADKKIKETTKAEVDMFQKSAYSTLVMVSGDQKTVTSHFANCDRDKYVSAASASIDQMINTGIDNFKSMAKE